MERKTKHRILGVIVLMGLVIASLPFFQNRKDVPSEPILVKAPPFPDQAVQMTTSMPDEKPATNLSSNIENPNPVNLMQTVNPTIVNMQKMDATKVDEQLHKTMDEQQIQHADNVHLLTNGELNKKAPVTITKAMPKTTPIKPTIDVTKPHRLDESPSLSSRIKLQNTSWVVQIGSFRDKENALRIVNRLRENGYKAFFKEINTSRGNNTRVFVGPLNQQSSARTLAARLESDLNIHGIIISYKPLAL